MRQTTTKGSSSVLSTPIRRIVTYLSKTKYDGNIGNCTFESHLKEHFRKKEFLF
jgi:hypothetical protein